MIQFNAFTGRVIAIQDYDTGEFSQGCTKMISLQSEDGALVNFILTPNTYVLNQELLLVGDIVTGYYDANIPVILIYPPQYVALVIVKEYRNINVTVSYFNSELVSEDEQLKLNIHPSTPILTPNGQAFTTSIANRNLLVMYGPTTKSIPAQTTPYQVIVLC